MFGILTIQQPEALTAGKRAALRLRPGLGAEYSQGIYRMARFCTARVTLCPEWKDSLREKRVSGALARLRERGVYEAVLPPAWYAAARQHGISAVSTGALREACAIQAVAEACRALELPLGQVCLAVYGRRLSPAASMQVLSLAKSVRTVRLCGGDHEELQAKLWRDCGIVDRGPMPENVPVIALCLNGGEPSGSCLMTVDLSEQGGEGEGLWWRPRLLPPEGALARLPADACPEAFAAALFRCGAVQAREIHVSRLDIQSDTQYNKGIVDNYKILK